MEKGFWNNCCFTAIKFPHYYGINFAQGDGNQRPSRAAPDNAGGAPPWENWGKCCQCFQCQWDSLISWVRCPNVNGHYWLGGWTYWLNISLEGYWRTISPKLLWTRWPGRHKSKFSKTTSTSPGHTCRCVALELAPKKVRVNSVNPGVIVTELQKTWVHWNMHPILLNNLWQGGAWMRKSMPSSWNTARPHTP